MAVAHAQLPQKIEALRRRCDEEGRDFDSLRVSQQCVVVIEEIRIETRDLEVIPGANPAFLREYPVRVRYLTNDTALSKVINLLEKDRPWVPVRALTMERLKKPEDHILVDLTVMAVVSDTGVPLEVEEKEE